MTPDIEKRIVLHASVERVWRAITDSTEFERWFGTRLDGPFVAGQATTGHMTPTEVDPVVAAQQESYRGHPWTAHVDEIEPMTRFVFRWNADPDSDALTTVTFALAPVDDGVELTITESGFDALPTGRRDAARESNDSGWAHQTALLAGYLEQHP